METGDFDFKKLLTVILVAVVLAVAGFFGYDLVKRSPSPVPTATPTPTATASATPTPVPTIAPTPTPTPSASPSPSPTPTAAAAVVKYSGLNKPTPGVTPTFSAPPTVKLWKGETRGFIVFSGQCVEKTSAPAGLSIKAYRMETVTTTSASAKGIAIGAHYDPLIPVTAVCGSASWLFIDVAADVAAAPGPYSITVGDMTVSVTVESKTMPVRPTVPLYMGIQPFPILAAHNLSNNTGVDVQGPLVKKYVDLLRAHRIEPFGQAIVGVRPGTNGELDFDNWKELGASYRQLVMDGSIAPVALYLWGAKTDAELQAAERAIAREPSLKGAWYYAWDEPNSSELATVNARLAQAKAQAPSLIRMVTTLSSLPDLQAKVAQFELWSTSLVKPYWVYGACPSHGSCSNGTLGTNTGTPDLMFDQPLIHARMFPIVAAALGGQSALYYTSNQAYGKMDPWVNQYQFGGNGDGQLVYPGRAGERGFTTNEAVGSLRLKMLRQGMFDAEKLLVNGKMTEVVQSAKSWLQDHTAVDQRL